VQEAGIEGVATCGDVGVCGERAVDLEGERGEEGHDFGQEHHYNEVDESDLVLLWTSRIQGVSGSIETVQVEVRVSPMGECSAKGFSIQKLGSHYAEGGAAPHAR